MQFDLHNAQMFLDDALIEQQVRLQRILHQPVKYYGNPLYEAGAPWEGHGIHYLGGVHLDPGDSLWKAWYCTINPPERPEITFAICMIVSDDGFSWRRPDLDVYRDSDGRWTNIVLDLGKAGRTAAPTIMHDPTDESEPWTMFISLAWPADSKEYRGYFLKSPDGVHWRWLQERPEGLRHGFHDRTTAMFDPANDPPYVIIGRGKEDIYQWDLPRTAHRCRSSLTKMEPGDPTRVIVPDLEDDPTGQIYHAQGFAYEDIYVGLFQWYWEQDQPWGEMELLFSRDSVEWDRMRPRVSFLPPTSGAFDGAITETALSPPIRTSRGANSGLSPDIETLNFYYTGGPAMHGDRHLTFGRSLGLAQLRLDGFCSLRTGPYPGILTTKPVTWPGGSLSVNATCLGGSGNGSLRIEVLTPDLKPIPGMTRDECDPLSNDATRQIVTWSGESMMDAMADREIRLRFHLDHYELYSFRAVDD
jgi:hypothetical protein